MLQVGVVVADECGKPGLATPSPLFQQGIDTPTLSDRLQPLGRARAVETGTSSLLA
ncbi:MAG: hypothetical protein WA996_23770 [Candidatus Promineifilaceae bacterium]